MNSTTTLRRADTLTILFLVDNSIEWYTSFGQSYFIIFINFPTLKKKKKKNGNVNF